MAAFMPFRKAPAAGVGGSGGVSVSSSLDTTATYKRPRQLGFLHQRRRHHPLHLLIKADGQVSGDKVQLGLKNLSTNGLISNPGLAFETYRTIPQSATVWSVREQYFTGGNLTESTFTNVNIVVGEWS